MEHVRKRIEDQHKMKIDATVDAIQLLALWGYDPNYGARPVRRVIKQNILPELTQGILKGVLKENDTILIDTELTANPNQKLSFKRLEAGSRLEASLRLEAGSISTAPSSPVSSE